MTGEIETLTGRSLTYLVGHDVGDLAGREAATAFLKTTGAQTISGLKTVTLGNSTTVLEYMILRTNDFGVGKPEFRIYKNSPATQWVMGFEDGAGSTGILTVDVSSLRSPGAYNTTTASAANVNVASNGELARSTSSEKYKTDIEKMGDEYADIILQMEPIWYRSKCAGDNPQHSFWGFSAEKMAKLDPRLVHWKNYEFVSKIVDTDDGEQVRSVETVPLDNAEPEGVAYDRIVVHLVALAQRLYARVDELEARMATLDGELKTPTAKR